MTATETQVSDLGESNLETKTVTESTQCSGENPKTNQSISNEDISCHQIEETSQSEKVNHGLDNTSESKNYELFQPVNIPIVKSRIGRPKGTNKPFWEFSKSKRSLSLKNLKRKHEENEPTQKRQKTERILECSQPKEVIEIENDSELQDNKNLEANLWIKTDILCLNIDSKASIEGGEMLDDRVIQASQDILKLQFPNVNGFQPTVLGQADVSFAPMPNDMVQVIFKGNNKCGHWLTISTLNLKPGYVNVYDSLNLELDNIVKNQICAILKHESTMVTVNKVPVQQQHGSADCGLFAIANSVAVCLGHEPNKILFRQDKMRSHLIRCLETGQFTMFPFDVNTRQKKNKTQKVRVYCICRRPHDGTQMIKCQNCSEWFHSNCVNATDVDPMSLFSVETFA